MRCTRPQEPETNAKTQIVLLEAVTVCFEVLFKKVCMPAFSSFYHRPQPVFHHVQTVCMPLAMW